MALPNAKPSPSYSCSPSTAPLMGVSAPSGVKSKIQPAQKNTTTVSVFIFNDFLNNAFFIIKIHTLHMAKYHI